jgi:3,5-epimerase/4-reductase
MKVMTIGAGFVADHLPYERIPEHIEIDWQKVRAQFSHYRPQVLINCIGKTGRPNVDWCEKHQSATAESNIIVPLLLADLCEKFDTHLINIGSGCIYFGESPNFGLKFIETPDVPYYPDEGQDVKIDLGWKETDFANPQSFYSRTKYSTDLILGQMTHVTTLRIRMPISDKNVPRNLINKLKGYKQVIDIPNSVTFMDDLTRCIDWAVNKRPGGIYHVANPQPLTAARIMKEYQKYVPDHSFEVIDEQQLDQLTKAKRSNCILNTEKLQSAGFQMTNSEEALVACMARYMEH